MCGVGDGWMDGAVGEVFFGRKSCLGSGEEEAVRASEVRGCGCVAQSAGAILPSQWQAANACEEAR